jgi:gamma-glutamylcyclotransferase (GGCT)/AIG2-like uncharacterized protein YtfP
VQSLFVYGTLRRVYGHPLHALIASHSVGSGEARVRGLLFDLGPYPGMTAEGDGFVHGELYEIDAEWPQIIAILDEYEGSEYRRELIEAELPSGEHVAAWAYVLNVDTHGLRRIESGQFGVR